MTDLPVPRSLVATDLLHLYWESPIESGFNTWLGYAGTCMLVLFFSFAFLDLLTWGTIVAAAAHCLLCGWEGCVWGWVVLRSAPGDASLFMPGTCMLVLFFSFAFLDLLIWGTIVAAAAHCLLCGWEGCVWGWVVLRSAPGDASIFMPGAWMLLALFFSFAF